jgi:hypothetical protein
MKMEQRLADALEAARTYSPSPDLWGRVVHSIEEDHRHRRRVIVTSCLVMGTIVVAVLVGLTGVESATLSGARAGRRIDWRLLEALELGVITTLIAALGPAIRRFGRGYVADVFSTDHDAAARLLRLLDFSYALLFGGYALVTVRLAPPLSYSLAHIGDQLQEAAIRIGGLLLVMGVLHAVTLVVLPLVGLVFHANRLGARLPRWVTILLAVGAVGLGLQMLLSLPIALGR